MDLRTENTLPRLIYGVKIISKRDSELLISNYLKFIITQKVRNSKWATLEKIKAEVSDLNLVKAFNKLCIF